MFNGCVIAGLRGYNPQRCRIGRIKNRPIRFLGGRLHRLESFLQDLNEASHTPYSDLCTQPDVQTTEKAMGCVHRGNQRDCNDPRHTTSSICFIQPTANVAGCPAYSALTATSEKDKRRSRGLTKSHRPGVGPLLPSAETAIVATNRPQTAAVPRCSW